MRLSTRLITDFAELERLSGAWQALLEKSSDDQLTQSPLWLRSWWRVFGEREKRQLAALALSDGERLVGLAPLCRRTHNYAPGLEFRRLELCPSGEHEQDEICSDYIGVIAERGSELEVAGAVASALVGGLLGEWDELVMPAMNGQSLLPWALADALKCQRVPARVELSALSPYIPLPESFAEYLEQLSPTRRYQLRRSIRDFERWAGGRARFEVAETAEQVERGFQILRELHTEHWRSKGESGVFSSEAFSAFHHELVFKLFEQGKLDLAWLSVDDRPLAAVYNIVHDGRVCFYQSGRRADLPPKARAGLVLHAHAIQRAIEAGRREYDFLPGPSQYKLGLSLATRPLVALRAARPSLRETARACGQQMALQARLLRAAVAPRSQLLQHGAGENRDRQADSGLATDLARALFRRLRSSLDGERYATS